VLLNGTIAGGTILSEGGTLALSGSATLDGVTWLGTLAPDGANVGIVDGLTVLASAGATAGTIDLSADGSGLAFGDSETLIMRR